VNIFKLNIKLLEEGAFFGPFSKLVNEVF